MEEEWTGYDGGTVQEWHLSASRIRVTSSVTVIPPRAFMDCEDLRVVDLNDVTTMSAWAFRNCRSLERVVWTTAAAVEIGGYAFAHCTSLWEIDLSNVSKIGRGAFMCCKALKSVSIPSSVVEIADFPFLGCDQLAEVELGEGIERIGNKAFGRCGALIRITIPASITEIECTAFSNCSGLEEVELNEGLQNIGEGSFQECTSLLHISVPSTTVKVESYAFAGCHQLTKVELQEGLQGIGSAAFGDCRSLERIVIPSSVKSVGKHSFMGCIRLAEVTLREGLQCLDAGAFDLCPLQHINIPPVALVVDIERSSCRLMRTVMPTPRRRKLVLSKWMQYRSPHQIEQVEAKVNEILSRPRQPEGQKITLIREWFAYYDWLDVTTMLELAIWKANMDANASGANGRQRSRQNCGNDMSVIIPGALIFLEG